MIEKLTPKAVEFEVFEENWRVVQLFRSLFTQWRIGPMGGYIGLNYQSVEFLLKIEDVENMAENFLYIQLMEAAALDILNKKD